VGETSLLANCKPLTVTLMLDENAQLAGSIDDTTGAGRENARLRTSDIS